MLVQVQEPSSMSAKEVCSTAARWKLPKLSFVPAGVAAGLIVTARTRPGSAGLPGNDMTRAKPAGGRVGGAEAAHRDHGGDAVLREVALQGAGSSSTFGLMVSVSLPLGLLTSVNAAVRIVPVPCADGEPVRLRLSATPAPTTPAADRPPREERQRRRSPCPMTSAG